MLPGRYTKEEIEAKIQELNHDAEGYEREASGLRDLADEIRDALDSEPDRDGKYIVGSVCVGCKSAPATEYGDKLRKEYFCKDCEKKIHELIVVQHFTPEVVAQGDHEFLEKLKLAFPAPLEKAA